MVQRWYFWGHLVIGKCEMPSTNISQENDHAIIIVQTLINNS